MADADPVDITVRIKNEFSDEIESLKAELGSIQDKVEAQLEINDNGEIEWAKMELESLERLIEAVLELDTEGVEQAEAQLDALDGRETESIHEVDVHKDGDNFDPPTIPGMDFGDAGAFAQATGKLDPRNDKAVGEKSLRDAIYSASGDQSTLSRGQKLVDEMIHDGDPGSKAIPGGLSPSGLTRQDFGVLLDRRLGSQDRLQNIERQSNKDVAWGSPISKNKGQFQFDPEALKTIRELTDSVTLDGEASEEMGNRDYESEDPKRRKFKKSGFQMDPEALETILQLVDADDPIGDDPRENNRNFDSEDVEKRNFKNDGFGVNSATEGDVADNIARLFGDGPEQIDITDPRMVNLDDMSDALNTPDRLDSGNDMPDPRSNIMSGSGIDAPENSRELFGSLGFEGSGEEWDMSGPDMEMGNMANRVVPNNSGKKGSMIGSLGNLGAESLEALNSGFSKLGKSAKKAFPTMRKWMNLFAALIPMMISLAGAAVGVAGALGAVGVAGGAMLGLGLLGWGDSLKESMKGSKKRVKEFKKELYSVFKPAIETFQPIADDFLSGLPSKLNGVVDALQNLTVFEGVLNKSVNAFIGMLENAIRAAYSLRTEINSIVGAFVSGLSGKIVPILKQMVKEVYKNWGMYKNLLGVLIDIGIIIYNLSMIVSKVVAAFRPLFDILAYISGILNGKFVVGLLTAMSAAFLLVKAIGELVTVYPVIQGIITLIGILIGELTVATALMSALTAGVVAIGAYAAYEGIKGMAPDYSSAGGFSGQGSGPTGMAGSSSGGDTYIMQVDGNTREKHVDQFKDMAENREYWQSSEESARNTGDS